MNTSTRSPVTMISVKCPIWARWHPAVSSVLMCARFFKRKHTLVFTGNANYTTVSDAIPYYTLSEISDMITMTEGASYEASLVGPSAGALGCLLASSLDIAHKGKYTTREVDDFLEKLFASDALLRKILRELDSIVLAIQAENPKLVSYSHAAFCDTVKHLNASLSELVNMKERDAAKDDFSLKLHVDEAALIPLKAVMDFVVHDAKMVVGPYRGVERLVDGKESPLSYLANPVANLILQTTIDYTNNDISSIYPAPKAESENYPHRHVLTSVHALLREYNSTNVLDKGESVKSNDRVTMGSQASSSTKPYRGTKMMPPLRN